MQEEMSKKASEKTYSNISDEKFMRLAKEAFGDTEKFWKSLHPSVQRAVVKAIKNKDSEVKPKTYNVGGFEITFDFEKDS